SHTHKVASSVVTASQSDEEHTLTGTPSGSSTNEKRASGSLGVSWSVEASGSAEVPAPATAAASALSDKADSLDSILGSPAQAPTPATDLPNRWCVDGQFQVYSDAMSLTDKGVMTRTLTLERRVLTGSLITMDEIHNLFTRNLLEWTARLLGRCSEEMAPLEQVRVWRVYVDISLPAIRRFLYGEGVDATRTPLTADFDYRWQIVKDGQFRREPSLRETTKRWMALHLSVDGEGADWVTEPKGAIQKANLTLTAKFLWLLVRQCLSLTAADNIATWDPTVLMAAIIAGFEVDFAWLLQVVMHERAFKVTVDIGLIRYEANELAPRRGTRPELPPLADDLADTVAQARTATQAASTDTTPVESIPGSSTSPSSSRAAPLPALVPLARAAVDNLRADIDTILEARVPESEAPSVEPAEDTVLAALFATSEILTPPPRENTKRCRGRAVDEVRVRKKERQEMEAARRVSLAEEEAHQMRASELPAGASSSHTVEIAGGTTDGAVVAEDTTECVKIAEDVGSGEPDPPAC
ncbi:hypothetical protein EJD97_005030, partial [Solanum chilense]